MNSRNPVFGKSPEFQGSGRASQQVSPYGTAPTNQGNGYGGTTYSEPGRGEIDDLERQYQAPTATAAQTGRMTLDDVVMRTATLFAVLLATAVPSYLFLPRSLAMPVTIGASLVAMVLSFLAQRHDRPNVPVMLAFAAFEGVFIGGISGTYAAFFGDQIIWNAILGTLCAFGAMLLLFKTKVVQNSPKFTKTLMIAGLGYFIFSLINLVGSLFHLWTSPYSGGGILAIGLSIFGVVLASFFLVLDFDFIQQGLRNGLPREYAWTAGFGLLTTLAWMYVEILRLFAILQSDD